MRGEGIKKDSKREKEWCIMEKNKRFSISMSDEMNETLKKAKHLIYPHSNINKMIIDLIKLGLQAESSNEQKVVKA